MSETQTIQIDSLNTGSGTQVREALNEDHVQDLAAALEAGAVLPPVAVMFDGRDRFLVDGFHRVEAHRRAGRVVIAAKIEDGARVDALLAACAANKAHGLKRSNADKRRSVETCLRVLGEMGEAWGDRRIADHVGVAHPFVAKVRGEVESVTTSPASARKDTRRVGSDGKKYPAAPARATRPPTPVEPASTRDDADDPDHVHTTPRAVVHVRAAVDDEPADWKILQDGIRYTRAVELAQKLGKPGADGAVFVRGNEAVIIVGKGWRDFVEFFGWK